MRRFGSLIFSWILWPILGKRMTDPTSGFVAVSRRALEAFSGSFPLEYPEIEALVVLKRKALRFSEVPTKMFPRRSGQSTSASRTNEIHAPTLPSSHSSAVLLLAIPPEIICSVVRPKVSFGDFQVLRLRCSLDRFFHRRPALAERQHPLGRVEPKPRIAGEVLEGFFSMKRLVFPKDPRYECCLSF